MPHGVGLFHDGSELIAIRREDFVPIHRRKRLQFSISRRFSLRLPAERTRLFGWDVTIG
jgi:hypothetical protein